MIKLKDVIWGEVDLIDEFTLSEDADDTGLDAEINGGYGNSVTMCCGGIGPGVFRPMCGK
ncbi:MAG: hypothetical protein J5717_08235 [Lachnospiraceae bacterium]|nr:hypothetical protein [Lachnospiraceae bacterium]MBR5760446.1 hypothetical protein [Lachnospiraceae bacterium]